MRDLQIRTTPFDALTSDVVSHTVCVLAMRHEMQAVFHFLLLLLLSVSAQNVDQVTETTDDCNGDPQCEFEKGMGPAPPPVRVRRWAGGLGALAKGMGGAARTLGRGAFGKGKMFGGGRSSVGRLKGLSGRGRSPYGRRYPGRQYGRQRGRMNRPMQSRRRSPFGRQGRARHPSAYARGPRRMPGGFLRRGPGRRGFGRRGERVYKGRRYPRPRGRRPGKGPRRPRGWRRPGGGRKYGGRYRAYGGNRPGLGRYRKPRHRGAMNRGASGSGYGGYYPGDSFAEIV